MEEQFNIKILSEKNGTKKSSSFRKPQNHLKNLIGLFSPESPRYEICPGMQSLILTFIKDQIEKKIITKFSYTFK